MRTTSITRSWTARCSVTLISIATSAVFAASPEVAKIVVSGQPTAKAVGVVEAKAQSKDAEKVVVQGRIKDFVDGQAVFTIADLSMKSCKDNGENCPTPWDFCCETRESITKNTATIKINGADKKTIKENVKGVQGLTNLSPVIVEGVAKKDKAGNLVVLADKIYLKK
ncbi:MAG: hypothetical protein ACR2IE_08295 [Candidatus Sumerlaeaceae bacterium]